MNVALALAPIAAVMAMLVAGALIERRAWKRRRGAWVQIVAFKPAACRQHEEPTR